MAYVSWLYPLSWIQVFGIDGFGSITLIWQQKILQVFFFFFLMEKRLY